ncbi:SAM-dependent methyltransferase [Synechococcus sp. R65.1]|jgi:23S rRNA (cytidine2498-2'-O)-methyltransferase|uniref:SAM-dependent methyltransferase n=1 Tax=unclassified Synechococcus TaxID=2626047 RepID=UPI0039C0EBAF
MAARSPLSRSLSPATHQWLGSADPKFLDLARREIVAADPEAVVQLLPEATGLMWVCSRRSFADLAQSWQANPPIFLRHICPIQRELWLDEGSLAGLRLDEELLAAINPALSFSVQTRLFGKLNFKPFQINEALAAQVVAAVGSPLQVRDPQQVISVVILANSTGIRVWLGLSLAEQNLSNWAGGIHRFRRDPGQISRSEFKLLEAIQVFHIPLQPGGRALDLGAAPGGWSRILRLYGQEVTAVDPAALDERLHSDAGICYHRLSAQAYLARCRERFHLILNDMRLDGRTSAHLMTAFAPHLEPEGAALMTLKLPSRRRLRVLQQTLDILSSTFAVVRARHLFHNRSEVTLYLRKGAQSAVSTT